jgi:hypothetical protein
MLQTSSNVSTPAWIERRRSMRFPVDDAAEVEIVGNPTVKLSGFLRDASQSGVRLALPDRVSRGAGVKIVVRGSLVLFGEIRYCRCAGDTYYAGVLIHTVEAAYGAAPELPFVADVITGSSQTPASSFLIS